MPATESTSPTRAYISPDLGPQPMFPPRYAHTLSPRLWVVGVALVCSVATLVLLFSTGLPAKAALVESSPTSPVAGCPNAWNIEPSPNTTGTVNSLAGLAVVSTGDIWAVGYHSDPLG